MNALTKVFADACAVRLGLALVRAITERHGGQVTIRSRVNQGTVVTMKLPTGEVTKS